MHSKVKEFCHKLDQKADKVRQLTKNFREQLDLTLFGYVRVYHDGKIGWLTSNAEQDRFLVESQSLESDPLVNKADLLKEGQYLWFNDREFPGCENFYRDRQKNFKVDHGMIIVRHCEKYLETMCVSGLLAKRPLYNLFMNETGLFLAFMDHFKKQLTPSLLNVFEGGLRISDLKKVEQHSEEMHLLSLEQRSAVVATCGWEKTLKLSRREKECLALLLEGYTYQKIGEILKLSERTIEHYLESVKNKLGVESRSELFRVAKILKTILKQ